jgi:hypothetical protein
MSHEHKVWSGDVDLAQSSRNLGPDTRDWLKFTLIGSSPMPLNFLRR